MTLECGQAHVVQVSGDLTARAGDAVPQVKPHSGTGSPPDAAPSLQAGRPARARAGRRPLLAAGNSNGDSQMLSFTRHADAHSLSLLVQHDAAAREFAYTAGAEQALAAAAQEGWTVVSMQKDWTRVF